MNDTKMLEAVLLSKFRVTAHNAAQIGLQLEDLIELLRKAWAAEVKDIGLPLEKIVGRTIASIDEVKIEGSYGEETMVVLRFTDGTSHGFVVRDDDE